MTLEDVYLGNDAFVVGTGVTVAVSLFHVVGDDLICWAEGSVEGVGG